MSITDLTPSQLVNSKNHQLIAWILLGGLLILRLPFLTGIAMVANPIWLSPIYEIGTYFLTACLIYLERQRLTDFHIDKLSLIIIILFKPLQTILLNIMGLQDWPLAFPHWPSFLIWMIAICLSIALWRHRQELPAFSKTSFGWFGIGLVVGLVITLLLAYPGTLQLEPNLYANPSTYLANIKGLPLLFSYQLGYAAVSEEPLFRGFLWGFLLKSGWKNIWIWLFQAFLFVLGHLFYLQTYPISFWVIVPFAALVFGAIAWRSKTISSSLAAHAISNALLRVTSLFLAYLLR
jgi:membrane protease YdiL (CAAX protease family)